MLKPEEIKKRIDESRKSAGMDRRTAGQDQKTQRGNPHDWPTRPGL